MNTARREEMFVRYRRTWTWTALVPSSAIFVVVACLRWHGRIDELPLNLVARVHPLFVISPILAWAWARRTILRKSTSSGVRDEHPHRAAPLAPRPVRLSGSFPTWAVWMLPLAMLIDVSRGAQRLVVFALCWRAPSGLWVCGGDGSRLEFIIAALPQACFIGFWWWRCLRDRSRVGVIEQTTEHDGSPVLLLRTPRAVRAVKIAAWDKTVGTLRLEGSREVWRALDPVDDLARGTPTLAAG